MKFKNPILGGFYPDPSICRAGEYFYLVNSSFEYFPAIPIFRSKNLVNWEQIGHCVMDDSCLGLDKCRNSTGIFATTIRYNEGIFYVVTTDVAGIGHFYVTATDPAGEWSKPIKVKMPGIDPSLYFEGDKTYFCSTGRVENNVHCTVIAEIDIKTGKIVSDIHELWKGTGGSYPEGPHIYKKDDYYYCLIAEGGTSQGHMVTMARSKDIFGPYESYENNPVFTHREHMYTEIHATGHMDLVQDQNDHWWAVFLGYRMAENIHHHLGRETFLAPVTWEENEYPVIGAGQEVTLEMECDHFPAEVFPVVRDFEDDFSSPTLNHRYAFLRKRTGVNYTTGDGLKIKGNGTSLDTLGTPSFIGFRQNDFACKTFCHISADFKDESRGGLTIFYDNTRHFQIYLREGKIEVEKTLDDFKVVVYSEELKEESTVLCIKTEGFKYYFGYGNNEKEAEENIVATGHTRHLSTETGVHSFTGVFFGIFADKGQDTTFCINKLTYREE